MRAVRNGMKIRKYVQEAQSGTMRWGKIQDHVLSIPEAGFVHAILNTFRPNGRNGTASQASRDGYQQNEKHAVHPGHMNTQG